MAIFKLGAMFDAISGKIGGQSFANYPQYQSLKNITQTNKAGTPKQLKQRAFTAYLSNSWRQLTTLQQQGWSATSVNYTYVNRVGDTITRNGYQTFCFCNQNLHVISQTLLTTAPLYVPVTVPKINIIDISSGKFKIGSNNSSATYLYALFAQANISKGANAQYGKIKFIGYITSAQLAAGYDVFTLIQNVFGTLLLPNKMAVIVDPINQTTGNRKQFVDIIQNIDVPMILKLTVSNGSSVTIPFLSGGTFTGSIDWGDGFTTSFTAWNSAGATHVYALAGTYYASISGTFPKFSVNNVGIKTFLKDVLQFGTNQFDRLEFYGCTGLINVSCVDTPSFKTNTSIQSLFRSCTALLSFNNINNWDTSQVNGAWLSFTASPITCDLSTWNTSNFTTVASAFNAAPNVNGYQFWDASKITTVANTWQNCSNVKDCSAWNITNLLTNMDQTWSGSGTRFSIATWNTSNVTIMNQTFRTGNYNLSLASNNFANVTNMTLLFQSNTTFSTANYDALLIKIVADGPKSGVTAGFTSAKYTGAGAGGTARATLVGTFGWIITDGGAV